jgi:mono/diheme cytochrome c family protein
MPSRRIVLLAVIGLCTGLCLSTASIFDPVSTSRASAATAVSIVSLHTARQSPSDLEVEGELADLPSGATRYITRDELVRLPQVSYTVTDDANFTGPTKVGGVMLDVLIHSLSSTPESDLVIAICADQYRANYPRDYIATHHPLLVLTVNGQPPTGWPKDSDTHSYDMGPYMISHPSFTPSFKVLSYADEAQIPWGVVRLDFRNEKTVFGAIAPRGPHAADAAVQAGFRIAQQNCFRCHNMGADGGEKSGVPWVALSQVAAASPELFANYVRNPAAVYPKAQMPGNPSYDHATVRAITADFQTFSPAKAP